MEIVRITDAKDLENLKKKSLFFEHGSIVALGFFDGMHLAHRTLVSKAKDIANQKNLQLTVFTFAGDDKLIKAGSERLFTDDEKLSLLKECGADCTVMASFAAFSEMTAEDFVKDFLVGTLNAAVAVCGYNFKFGKGASGDSDTLCELMKTYGAEATVVEEFTVGATPLSSTYIRRLLSERRIRESAKLLGKPYFISGRVSHGLGLGKKLGIPTVNVALAPERFTLPPGVYATVTEINGRLFPSLTNVGVCPTFDEREKHSETFILNFNNNIYDTEIRIYFIDYLREEKKFLSSEELTTQINVDKIKTLKLFGETKWQELGLNLP